MSVTYLYKKLIKSDGSSEDIEHPNLEQLRNQTHPYWLHLDYTCEDNQKYIQQELALDEHISESLISMETRPRIVEHEQGVYVCLRGVNLYPDSDPEELVSIRLWIEQNRIISTRKRQLLSINDIVDRFNKKAGPKSTGDFLALLCERLTSRMSNTIEELEDKEALLEEELIQGEIDRLRSEFSQLRKTIISLKRYLSPQKEALNQLVYCEQQWLTPKQRHRIRESLDRLTRYLENLDEIRDRAMVSQEELMSAISEQMNNRMYVMSMVAAIFLPLGFLTGLLGINIGGMPGTDNPYAFYAFCILLVIICIFQFIYFHKKKWI